MFVAILKQFVLKDVLKKYQWVGIILNCLSIVLVGFTAMMIEASNSAGTRSLFVKLMYLFEMDDSLLLIILPQPVLFFLTNTLPFLHYFINLSFLAAEAAGTVIEAAPGGGTALLGVVLILMGEWFVFDVSMLLFCIWCMFSGVSGTSLKLNTDSIHVLTCTNRTSLCLLFSPFSPSFPAQAPWCRVSSMCSRRR